MANEAQEFNLGLDRFVQRLGVTMEVAVRNVVGRIFENVIRLTPVDTGWARNNWYVTINRRGDAPGLPNPFPSGSVSNPLPAADPTAAIAAGRVGDFFWLNNGVPYIGALENGHSRQAPHGMVAVAVASAQAFIDTYAKTGDYRAAQLSALGVPGAR